MGKVIATINMTLDGYCDHTAIVPDEAMHYYYADLLNNADYALYGRITYELMEYWRPFVNNPSGNKSMDIFAKAINRIPKIVFSRTLNGLDWETAELANDDLEIEVKRLKRETEGKILVCSPSLIVQLTNLKLIDSYELLVHPIIVGTGLQLFKNITEKTFLKLIGSKTFDFGANLLNYEKI